MLALQELVANGQPILNIKSVDGMSLSLSGPECAHLCRTNTEEVAELEKDYADEGRKE
jgi:hypothetical protein